MKDNSIKKHQRVSYPSGEGILIVEMPDVNGIVIVQDISGEYRRVSADNIKPVLTTHI